MFPSMFTDTQWRKKKKRCLNVVSVIRITGFTLQVFVHDLAVHYSCIVSGLEFQCTASEILKMPETAEGKATDRILNRNMRVIRHTFMLIDNK